MRELTSPQFFSLLSVNMIHKCTSAGDDHGKKRQKTTHPRLIKADWFVCFAWLIQDSKSHVFRFKVCLHACKKGSGQGRETSFFLLGFITLVEPRGGRVHDFRPCCKRGALGVLKSATRELLNNSDCHLRHQVQERCRSPVCLQHCLIRQYAVYGTY